MIDSLSPEKAALLISRPSGDFQRLSGCPPLVSPLESWGHSFTAIRRVYSASVRSTAQPFLSPETPFSDDWVPDPQQFPGAATLRKQPGQWIRRRRATSD